MSVLSQSVTSYWWINCQDPLNVLLFAYTPCATGEDSSLPFEMLVCFIEPLNMSLKI